MAYQPLSSLQYLQGVQANAKPMPTNPAVPGILSSLTKPKVPANMNSGVPASFPNASYQNTSTPIGVKTKSPQDTIKPPVNTTPQPQTVKPQSGGQSTEGGTQNTNGYNTNAPAQTQGLNTGDAPAGTKAQSGGYDQNNSGLYGQLVTDLANRSKQSGQDYQDAQAEAKRVSDEQTALAEDYAHKTNNIAGTAGFLTQQTGLQGQLNNQYNTVQGALASQYAGATNRLGAANTQQGLQQSALSTAASNSAPNGNIINVNPITGLPVAGGSLAQLANTAGQVQGIQSGAAAAAAAGGQTSAQNQIALGTASTGANAHSIGDYTSQVNTTQKSVESLNNIASQLIPNMGTVNFNPNSTPIGNQTFQQYFANKNPAAYAGITSGLAEIKNQISNVVASATGLTPTGVTALADKVDLTAMSPQQLNDFLEYINQFAQSNMAAANQSIKDIQNGTQPKPNPMTLPTPTSTGTGEAALATGTAAAQGFLNAIKSSLGSVIGGAVGGYAESKLQ